MSFRPAPSISRAVTGSSSSSAVRLSANPRAVRAAPIRADISTVYALRQAALILGETEDMVSEASIGMFSEDGCITISDDAFSDDDCPINLAPSYKGVLLDADHPANRVLLARRLTRGGSRKAPNWPQVGAKANGRASLSQPCFASVCGGSKSGSRAPRTGRPIRRSRQAAGRSPASHVLARRAPIRSVLQMPGSRDAT